MPAENITVKAQWKINQYTITFDTNGGSDIAPITQDYGTEITAPDNPTRKGYTFKGWDKEIPETMPAEKHYNHGTVERYRKADGRNYHRRK